MRGELWIVNWAQAKVAEYLEASMWLAPVGGQAGLNNAECIEDMWMVEKLE